MKEKAKIKRLSFLFLIVLAILCCFPTPIKTVRADSSDSLVILLLENHSENEIDIDVKMVTNTGVSGMTLELQFNRKVFEYVGYERGEALAELDLMATNLSVDNTLPVKFNWFRNGGDFKNDVSTGIILKLRFRLRDGAKSGKYDIAFKYGTGDISYVENENVASKSAIISKAVVTISNNNISGAEIVEDVNQSGISGLLIASIVVASLAIVAFAVLISIKIIRKKRGDNNWSKI